MNNLSACLVELCGLLGNRLEQASAHVVYGNGGRYFSVKRAKVWRNAAINGLAIPAIDFVAIESALPEPKPKPAPRKPKALAVEYDAPISKGKSARPNAKERARIRDAKIAASNREQSNIKSHNIIRDLSYSMAYPLSAIPAGITKSTNVKRGQVFAEMVTLKRKGEPAETFKTMKQKCFYQSEGLAKVSKVNRNPLPERK